jgi:exopolysaccharide biosynthesis polyprenyl glycosylphosphotransferase
MLRSRVFAFLRTDDAPAAADIPPDAIRGSLADLPDFLRREPVDQIVLANAGIGTDRMMDILLLCERHLIAFNMVPDLFHVLTTSMDVQSLDDIPLLGLGRWPLDHFWNRALKRACDVAGAAVGLVVAAPVMLAAAAAIKRDSPGPIFYHQERCGEKGRTFRLHKLRTMAADAESRTGPVFAAEDDPRRTRVGGFLRRYNLDELPQLWNVLRGEMSLVGPRPERPHFVEQFKEEISRYMWRHVSKPGLTGWAQVNGLRGNTSIEERVKYDLYYLEHWSLAFDLKILLRTAFARENAY